MKQKKNKTRVFAWIALGVCGLSMVAAIVGLGCTMSEVSEKIVSKTPDAILASAGVSSDKPVSLPVMYYDQRSDDCVNMYDIGNGGAVRARQFEWSGCGYYNESVEKGLVEYELDEEHMIVGVNGKLIPNKNMDMNRWYGVVDGKSANYAGIIGMQYRDDGAVFEYKSDAFYPLDEVHFSDGDVVNKDKHNHLFTMNFAVPFTVLASGEEQFEVIADDDTFVFVGDRMVIDMGGIHEAMDGKFVIHENGEVYAGINGEEMAYTGVNVVKNDGNVVRIFHADRDSQDSVFAVKFSGMNISVTNTELADDGGVQVAYDPNDPTYVAPLGESKVFYPDSTKGLMVMAAVEGVLVVMASVLVVSAVRFVLRQKSKE